MDKTSHLIEHLMNILNVSFFREPTRRILCDVAKEISNLSTNIVSDFMDQLSIPDLDMTLDYVVDFDRDTDTILENIVDTLQRTSIPYTLNYVRSIPGIKTNRNAKCILAKIWYRRFVTKKKIEFCSES